MFVCLIRLLSTIIFLLFFSLCSCFIFPLFLIQLYLFLFHFMSTCCQCVKSATICGNGCTHNAAHFFFHHLTSLPASLNPFSPFLLQFLLFLTHVYHTFLFVDAICSNTSYILILLNFPIFPLCSLAHGPLDSFPLETNLPHHSF